MQNYIEEEITLHEFADRFLNVNDYSVPDVYDTSDLGIEVLTLDDNGNEVYKNIDHFVIKDKVKYHYTDGKIKVAADHRFIENGETVFAKDHSDFKKIDEEMFVTDIEVADLHSYLANGRLNHNTTSGGKGLAFHSSVRIRLKGVGKIKQKVNGVDRIVGITVRAQIIKNRMGPPLKSADFDIYFDRGIDDYGSWLKVLKENKILSQGGAWYSYEFEGNNNEELKFQSKDFVELLETRLDVKEELYKKICKETILQYRSGGIDPENIEIDESFDDE